MRARQCRGEPAFPLDSDRSPRPTVPFGPAFFLTHIAAFLRDHCPAPTEKLPYVTLHLASGEILELCHVVALAPRCVALAVFEDDAGDRSGRMRTELLPYEMLTRITVRASGRCGAHIGFRQESPPIVCVTPKEVLETAGTLRGGG